MLNRACVALRAYGFGTQRIIPSLDGLRAISIAFVLLAHLSGTRHFPSLNFLGMDLGQFGVRVFFVISGYLITSILLEELGRKGSISLPRFYFRRTLRLFPASYFLIAVTAVLAAGGGICLERRDLVFAVTYTMNYYDARGWPLGHLWSLAVEEQFYLLWPLTLRSLPLPRCRRLLLITLVLGPLFRITSPYVGPAFNFLRWSDALGTGCMLAIMRDELGSIRGYSRLLASRWVFLVPLAALAANHIPSTKVTWVAGETIMNVAIAVSVDWAMRNPGGLIGRLLNQPAISFAGVLSYSLYLWQQLFLDRTSDRLSCAFPLNIVLAFTMALVSYLLIEAPFLRLRMGIERTWRRRSAELGEAPLARR
jgi:peptidoglycan/LPS O-acetylase OafA/YrhL